MVGSKAQSPFFNLTVRAYRGDSLLFTNTSSIRFNPGNVSTFLRTDRSRYRPGDPVRITALSLQLDNRPYKGRVDVSVEVGVSARNKGRGAPDRVFCGGSGIVRAVGTRTVTLVSCRIPAGGWQRAGGPRGTSGLCRRNSEPCSQRLEDSGQSQRP